MEHDVSSGIKCLLVSGVEVEEPLNATNESFVETHSAAMLRVTLKRYILRIFATRF